MIRTLNHKNFVGRSGSQSALIRALDCKTFLGRSEVRELEQELLVITSLLSDQGVNELV